ncbi:MAG: Sterol desaturase [Verrucomicrobiaceae bacterium]|nr:Sterol desaturase [Verrucomicrobiaceae bacterium]
MTSNDVVNQANGVIFSVMGVVLVAELCAGRLKTLFTKHDVLTTATCMLVGMSVMRPLAGLLIAHLFALLLPAYAGALSAIPLWSGIPLVLLTTEFCFYWVHRMAHNPKKHPFLYRLHRTHHSASFMNISVFWRVNVFWTFVTPHGWVLGLAIYLGMTQAAAVSILVIMFWNIFTHSDFRWDDWLRRRPRAARVLRLIEHVVVTPGMHHTHHGYGRDGKSYRNFAVFFSFYDFLFGTIHHPQGRPAQYGLPGAEVGWLEQALYPLVWRKTKAENDASTDADS